MIGHPVSIRPPSSVRMLLVTFLLTLLPLLSFRHVVVVDSSTTAAPGADDGGGVVKYYLIGVSGGLQDGFPDHSKLDYRKNLRGGDGVREGDAEEEVVRAVFVGKALVRGTKAYLDVMQDGWREYGPEPEQPIINPKVMVSGTKIFRLSTFLLQLFRFVQSRFNSHATLLLLLLLRIRKYKGCDEHANVYWVYAVDSRQFGSILFNEPRFLSITPDTALVDLTSNETSEAVKVLASREIEKTKGITDINRVAIPIVVAVWYNGDSYVPSPAIREYYTIGNSGATTEKRFTRVTNFPESLALWANVNDEDRIKSSGLLDGSIKEATAACDGTQTCHNEDLEAIVAARDRYWDGIRRAVRHAEANRLSLEVAKTKGPPFACLKNARLGTGPETARINYPFTRTDLSSIFDSSAAPNNKYFIDFDKGTLSLVAAV